MKTAIVYYSQHHENTRKIVEAIARENDVTFINVTEGSDTDLSRYDRIGFASGIYFSNMAKPLQEYAEAHLPARKKVFFIATCGMIRKNYFNSMKEIAREKKCRLIGGFMCKGFDTFGPFRFIGGIAKKHPNEKDIKKALEFYKSLG